MKHVDLYHTHPFSKVCLNLYGQTGMALTLGALPLTSISLALASTYPPAVQIPTRQRLGPSSCPECSDRLSRPRLVPSSHDIHFGLSLHPSYPSSISSKKAPAPCYANQGRRSAPFSYSSRCSLPSLHACRRAVVLADPFQNGGPSTGLVGAPRACVISGRICASRRMITAAGEKDFLERQQFRGHFSLLSTVFPTNQAHGPAARNKRPRACPVRP